MNEYPFMGVGLGPGDPELITLKAHRLILQADVIAYISNDKGVSQARTIAQNSLSCRSQTALEIPLVMPMCEDRQLANQVYDQAAVAIGSELKKGRRVVFLCEGDPLFFASFIYLLERLKEQYHCEVVPGISSVHAASAALKTPLTVLSESMVVVSGRHSEEKLIEALIQHDSVVILKAGRFRPRILTALKKTQRLDEARYLEYIGREQELIETDMHALPNEPGPYFSLFVVLKNNREHQ